jgi:hypothetical protein
MQVPTNFDFPLVAALTAFIALPVKFLVDTIKGAVPRIPSPTLPLIGLAIGFVLALLVLVAAEISFKASVFAQCVLAAITAQLAAMAATWNQARVEKRDETIEQALKMSASSSVADVKAAVAAKE